MTKDNVFLDSTLVAREMLRLLHANLGFVGSITRTYSDEFAQKGAKIGDRVQIRMPNKFKGREGRIFDRSLIRERTIDISLNRYKGVDMAVTSEDLTLDLDDFSKRLLRPGAKQLATHIESDVLSLTHQVGSTVYCDQPHRVGVGEVLRGKRLLDDSLVPRRGRRGLFCPAHKLTMTESVRDHYNPAVAIGRVYRDQGFGRLSGFDYEDTTVMPPLVSGGAALGQTSIQLKEALSGNNLISCAITNGAELKPGDSFAFDQGYAVHPETKAPYPYLKFFSVVSVETDNGQTRLTFTPPMDLRGPYRNVSIGRDGPQSEGGELERGTFILKQFPANGFMESSLLYHPDAFGFVTAGLEVPRGVDFAARETHDGISMRVVRDYDPERDEMLCRFDVLYGYGLLDGSQACRLVSRAPD